MGAIRSSGLRFGSAPEGEKRQGSGLSVMRPKALRQTAPERDRPSKVKRAFQRRTGLWRLEFCPEDEDAH